MKKLLLLFSVFSLCHFAIAELSVEWIDENTIVVSGYGYGDVTNENVLGSCTNCLAISPDEMRAIKSRISDLLIDAETLVSGCFTLAELITNRIHHALDDISGFRRFDTLPTTGNIGNNFVYFTNYVFSVNNSQTSLDKSVQPASNTSASRNYWVSYNNGIYDYASTYASPQLSATLADANSILDGQDETLSKLRTIGTVVNGITEESCQCSGGGSGSCSDCPCEEQWETLLDYIRHIDDDQHKRYIQLDVISNNVFSIDKQFDSYSKLVSGILYNDATIVVDDGANSWTNVYRRGSSDLYDYDKSNILQRIELLLFGVAYGTPTNWSNVVDSNTLEGDKTDIEDDFDDIKTSVQDGYHSLDSDVKDLRNSIREFFDALNFFGSGNFGEFALTDPFTVFDVYEFEITSGGNAADFRNIQRISRTAFQILYWTGGVVFMFFFWLGFIRLVTKVVLSVIKYINNALT